MAVASASSIALEKPAISPDLIELAEVSQLVGPLTERQASLEGLHLLNADGEVGIQLTSENVFATRQALMGLDFEEIAAWEELNFLEGFLPPANLPLLASLSASGLMGVLPIYRPLTNVGSVTSQADTVHESARVRATSPGGVDGSGVTIGVLSDSYNALGGAAADIASGDLPSAINVLEDLSGGGLIDEGRAMLQLVHDVAPGASLAFATAFTGQGGFAQNILDLADPALGNADIIVDDIFYFAEPFFQDGVIAQAVETVVGQGVSYFSSAGNSADQSYESSSIHFTSDTLFASSNYDSFFDFDTGPGIDTRQAITIPGRGSIRLSFQWDDPFYTLSGVDTDLDLLLVESGTTRILASASVRNVSTQTPVEILNFTNSRPQARTFELLIGKFTGPAPGRLKYVNFGDDVTIEYDTNSSTVVGHAAAANASGVAAVFYGDQTEPESFTSIGPTTILFDANGNALAAAEVRETPRLAAVDGTNTTFFGSDVEGDGFPNFFGTSAAAPHAAAVAALVKEANPAFSPADIYARLESTAEDLGSPGFDNVTGAGLINAYDAVFGPAIASPLNVADGFESGVLSNAWETHSTGPGRILVSDSNGPSEGTYHLTLDTFASFGLGLNEAILRVDASGVDNLLLQFDFREFGDEDNPMPASFVGSVNADGVAFSVDGTNWYEIVELTDAAGNAPDTYTQMGPYDLSSLAEAQGLTLDSDVRIKFQQFDDFPIASDGFAFDNVVLFPVEVMIDSAEINENSAAGSLVGQFSISNPALLTVDSFSLIAGDGDTDNAAFQITGDQLLTNAALDFESKSSYSIRVAAEAEGFVFEKPMQIHVIDLPEVLGIRVGDTASQRSQVQQLLVTFDGAVSIAPDAFEIEQRGGGGIVDHGFSTELNGSGQTVAMLTFSGPLTRGSGALLDGNYQLTIDATLITRESMALDGDNDGSPGGVRLFGTQEADAFFARYGDTNGDRVVGIAEFGAFRATFGKLDEDSDFNELFDYEGNGAVGISDFGQFRARFGIPLAFE